MTRFELPAPPNLLIAVAEHLDRWAFLYGTARAIGASPEIPVETDTALRARLLRIATGATRA